jgi:hypothetical protein
MRTMPLRGGFLAARSGSGRTLMARARKPKVPPLQALPPAPHTTVASALAELELEEAAAAEGRSAPSVLAVERAARAVEDVLSGLLAGGREGA